MRILLDTHAVIWYMGQQKNLSETAIKAIESPFNQIYVSSVSLWEMAIKGSSGKLKLPSPLRDIMTDYETNGSVLLPILPHHALLTESLPWHHKDPFDRMLIAQAIYEDLTLISKDKFFGQYPVLTVW